jgi:hypothetical protein
MGDQAKMQLPNRRRTDLSPDAFAARAKRAKGATVRRYLNETDRDNNRPSGAKLESYAKRSAAANMRQARTERVARQAAEFYTASGFGSGFARRQVNRTSQSPNFGTKKRGRRKP